MTSEKVLVAGQAREIMQTLQHISQLLRTGLSNETLATCIRLCELGLDPEVLAHLIREIRKMEDTTEQQSALPS